MSGEKPLALPECLPGEDRTFGGGLIVDLVPETAWGQSVKNQLSRYWWRRVSRGVRKRADWACEICGDPEDATQNRYLSCHERWDWEDDHGVQRLARLMALCVACDSVTHLGRYLVDHDDDSVPRRHLAAVRGWSDEQTTRHIKQAWNLWRQRSTRSWTMNAAILAQTPVGPHLATIQPGESEPLF